MAILQLMIAHLLGDFVFQSNRLIQEKHKSWRGTFKHSLIIAALSALVLFPYWHHLSTWVLVLTLSVLHFLQDVLKIKYIKENKPHRQPAYFLDQFVHLSFIFILGSRLTELSPLNLPKLVETIYFSPTISFVLLALILLTYTFDITIYEIKGRHYSKNPYVPNYVGMLERILSFVLIYLLMLALFQLSFAS